MISKDIIIASIVAALVFFAYTGIKQRGVLAERVRVETQGTKVDAKAKKARAAVATRPATGVLDGQWRD